MTPFARSATSFGEANIVAKHIVYGVSRNIVYLCPQADNDVFATRKMMLTVGQTILCPTDTNEKSESNAFGFLAGMAGFEPAKCQSQSLVPYHLATPQYYRNILPQQNRYVNITVGYLSVKILSVRTLEEKALAFGQQNFKLIACNKQMLQKLNMD